MSYVYLARPVTLSGASMRGRGLPICLKPAQLSASQGLMSPSAAWTSMGLGSDGKPPFAGNVTVGSFGFSSGCCAMASPPLRRLRGGGRPHGLEHAAVGAAAAEVAGEAGLDLVERRARDLREERRARHHEPGRAEAALHGVLLDERGLQWAHLLRSAQALDGR